MVGFNLRYHRHVRNARRAIAQELIGQVELVRSVWSSRSTQYTGIPEWRRRGDLGGGVLSDLAVHHVDLWRFVVASEIDEVFAWQRSEAGAEGRTATITGRLRSGALAVSAFSQCAAEAHEMEVYGQHGRLSVSPYRFDGYALSVGTSFSGDLGRRAGDLVRAVRALPGALASAERRGSFLASYRATWRHFADRAREGIPTESTFDDGRRALEIVVAATESIRTGRPVNVGGLERRDGNGSRR
ncbi:MAG TPA: Gfo/Idh/MocA family oxidoreductase [Candidatus Binatia bacterium]|nr:Gfo/Idh/MocA family oxidoreductase [Candidatus Binatia bacterium]